MTYIATFYSHFGAIRFKKMCGAKGITVRLMPVPRDLSSSCGTCARYEAAAACPTGDWPEETEQVVEVLEKGYHLCYRDKDS